MPSSSSKRSSPAVFGKFIPENHITATPAEIKEMKTLLHAQTEYPKELKNLPGFTPEAFSATIDKVYIGMIIDWKVNSLLYKKYGGRIIFQQANPTQAIDAQCQYLKEQETNKAFTIFDPAYRKGFWDYCHMSGADISKSTNMDIP